MVFKFLGFLAESFVFSYLGLTFFSYKTFQWSYDLIIVEFLVILIGRGLGTFGLFGLLKLCGYEKDNPKKITWKELTFIWYAGLIRGAIAFGLVLRIEDNVVNRSVIVTTCLTLVVVSTVFFGSTVGLLGKCMFGSHSEAETEREVKRERENIERVDSVGDDTMSNTDSTESRYEPLLHENERESLNSRTAKNEGEEPGDCFQRAGEKKKKKCSDYLIRFDKLIMRPILIHKYEKDKTARAQEFYDMFNDQGDEVRKLYTKQKTRAIKEAATDKHSAAGSNTGSYL